MDFFDPQKQKRHTIRLAVGYALMGVVLILATTVLLYHAYGFGLDTEGRVIQNGLVFVSSRPDGAEVYINGAKHGDKTNTRLNLPSGQYVMELKRDGYRDWKRALTIEGGSVERFDYPMLFPVNLETTAVKQYAAASSLVTGSLDRRWLLVATPEQNVFDLYDMNAKELLPRSVAISADILAASSTTTGWQAMEWARDNRHVLLKRSYDQLGQPGTEYILFDRDSPELSSNLSVAFGFTPTSVELRDRAYDQYYLFDQNSGQLFTADLEQPTPKAYINDVISYAAERNVVLYATAQGAEAGKVLIRVKVDDDPSLIIRHVPAGTNYLLDMGTYKSTLYIAAGAASENRVFLYRDPIGKLGADRNQVLVPAQILKVGSPDHLAFSPNGRFVIAESADRFAVYDAETDRGYAYQTAAPLDAPQVHAEWMDDFRLMYVSGGAVVVFDYDGTNLQNLSSASPSYLPVFDRSYRFLYAVDAQNALTRTALLTPEDL